MSDYKPTLRPNIKHMSINPIKTEIPSIEGDLEVIKKNGEDKISVNESSTKNELRDTYATQTVDTKIKPSQK